MMFNNPSTGSGVETIGQVQYGHIVNMIELNLRKSSLHIYIKEKLNA